MMRRRLALTVFAVTAMVVTAFVVPLASLVRTVVADRATSAAEREARTLAGVLASVADRANTSAVVDQLTAEGPARAAVYYPDGGVIGVRLDLPADRLERARRGAAFTSDTPRQRVVVVPVRTADGSISVAAVGVARSELRRGVGTAQQILVGLGALLVLFATALADRLARSTVRALERLGDVTMRLRHGELDARAQTGGVREVAQVARAVNDLADQIDVLLAAEREAAADLSHRLRTPLTALRLQVERVRSTSDRERLAASVEDLTNEVTAVIEAARQPPRRPRRPLTPVDLVDVVDRRVAFWSVLAHQQHRSLSWEPPGHPVMVAVAEEELATVLDALLTNVFHHTPEGVPMRVTVGSSAAGATLVVEDDGPGVKSSVVAERGRSGDGSTGLGLDIVRRAAEASGGAMQIGRTAAGGTRVELCLGDAEDRAVGLRTARR